MNSIPSVTKFESLGTWVSYPEKNFMAGLGGPDESERRKWCSSVVNQRKQAVMTDAPA